MRARRVPAGFPALRTLAILAACALALSCASAPKTAPDRDGKLRFRVGVSGGARVGLEAFAGALGEEMSARRMPVTVLALADEKAGSGRATRKGWIDLVLEAPADAEPEAWAAKAAEGVAARLFSGRAPVTTTLFRNGEGGWAVYRIPSLLMAGNTLIAFAEARSGTRTDSEANDLVSRTSLDGGLTWGPIKLVAGADGASFNNPTAIYLPEQGRVLLVFQRYPPRKGEATTARGIEGDNICRVFVTTSDDSGATWTAPRDITAQAKTAGMSAVASGPGRAIRVTAGPDKGRILVPCNSSGDAEGWYDYLVASDDGGETWFILPGHSWYGGNESQIVQVGDTEFLVNARDHRYSGGGAKAPLLWSAWVPELGNHARSETRVRIEGREVTWGEPRYASGLVDPRCQGSLFRWSGLSDGGPSVLLFSNAASRTERVNGVVRMSLDEGLSWPVARRIWGGERTAFQYSVLERLPENRVGCLFECWPEIEFASFGLEWLEAAR